MIDIVLYSVIIAVNCQRSGNILESVGIVNGAHNNFTLGESERFVCEIAVCLLGHKEIVSYFGG